MEDKIMTILSFIIGILGLVATLVGAYFTYTSFVNPIHRFKRYLKNPDGWEKCPVIENHLTVFRHKKYPGYQIVVDWDKQVVENYQEEWIRDYPDREHNTSYFVRLEANGIFLMKELFISLDGGRAFVPSPRRELKNNEFKYWYDTIQVQLANIIGEYSWEKNLEDFATSQNKQIERKKK